VKRLAIALLLASSPAAAHDARSSEWFKFTTTEAVVIPDTARGPVARGVQFTNFSSDLEYGDGHQERVTGQCSFMVPNTFTQVGVCVAPGAYTLGFRCQVTPAAKGPSCWGRLTGALDGRHNGLTGRVTYQITAEGITGVGNWDY
jgi:hypothetical protein